MSTTKTSKVSTGDDQAAVNLKILQALSLNERIESVAQDLQQREPQYGTIEAHDLADLLNVPAHWRPDEEWSFIRYAPIISVEEYAKHHSPASEIVYLIEDAVSTERLEELLAQSDQLDDLDDPSFSFLTEGERCLLENAIAENQLKANVSNGINCIARYSLESDSGIILDFEGDIEDDAACINLRTPYDKRVDRFINITGCLTSNW